MKSITAESQVYGWHLENGLITKPDFNFPDCVIERLQWINKVAKQTELTFIGAVNLLFGIDNEPDIQDEFTYNTSIPYQTMTDEYKSWLNTGDFRRSTLHQQALMLALIYGLSEHELGGI